jgi:hypothetical protein
VKGKGSISALLFAPFFKEPLPYYVDDGRPSMRKCFPQLDVHYHLLTINKDFVDTGIGAHIWGMSQYFEIWIYSFNRLL